MTGSSVLSVSASLPVRLPTRFLEKIWGAHDLSPWYPSSERKIGEVWFEADLPLLVKFIFTTERLSVQVHPDDAFAATHEKSRGKTEMWYVLRADPGAKVAIGLRKSVTPDQLRESARTGEIETLLRWIDVQAGDAFFIPAGTVHAVGSGLAMCEVQQHSDITYRLYDYGRSRELHLDKAVQVASTASTQAKPRMLPIDCEYFHTELARTASPLQYVPAADRFHILIFVSGSGSIAGQTFREGEAWLVPAGAGKFQIEPTEPVKFLRTWIP